MSTANDQEMETATCPCGGGPTVDACCGPYLSGARKAPSAEALMRARYSAYVLEDVDFIGTSNHPDTQDDVDLESARRWAKAADWQGLDIVETGEGPGEDEAWVEFVARYDIGHDKHGHHERARFKRHEGGWAYLDGDLIKPRPIVREGPRIGRNDPCTCGSGKKYKKCHGA